MRRTYEDENEENRLGGSVHDQVTHDIFAALGGVFAHVKLEKRLDGMGVIDADG
ncbi:MAG: hypothetical protein QOI53_4122, partial [Verrucomicrobiota bacterium]|nr:hypothetical protein [Verrucomicrobiota bacterium]